MDFLIDLAIDYYFEPLTWLGSMVGYAAGVGCRPPSSGP